MDAVELNRKADMCNDTYMEDSLSLIDSMECDIFGEQVRFPRIGEEYQVGLPKLVNKSDYLLEEYYQADGEHVSMKFLMGLPIPITLIQHDSEHLSQKTTQSFDFFRNPTPEVNGLMSGESSSRNGHSGYFLVPGSASQCLSDDEMGSFLFGLYIFLKNFILLKRFLESKFMGDIQAYYYGKFYGTHEHSRWSERRKFRGRKCVVGQKLFIGVRQQEFFSRILPVLSDECQHAVQKVMKIFEAGKMDFEEFIFSLKSLVGTSVLVEAVGIGKGNHDLTCMVLETTTRTSQGISTRPEIPIGKECASLTYDEIIKYLTGDYRLSKARSNDLFWEAVWPRLLAKGWHSEQPIDQGYVVGSKNNLVFLVPGIKKFSRWKLVRGTQYFDSVSDVLNKVALEPTLLDLDHEENEPEKSDEDDVVLTQRRHCYLQPHTPNHGVYGMKFTIVDTSLGGGKPYIIKELRSLSVDLVNGVDSPSPIEVSYEDAPDVSGPDDTMHSEKDEIFNVQSSVKSSNGETHYDSENVVNISCVNPDSKNPIGAKKYIFDQRMKEENSENVATSSKRRRLKLISCNGDETSSVVPVNVGPEIPPMTLLQNLQEKPVPEMATCGSNVQELVETAPRARTMIDLNLPPDSDTAFTGTEETREPNEKSDEPVCSNASNNTVNQQRRSTRNRPPTTRALEAFANGFLTVNSRGGKGSSRSNSTSRLSRRARGGVYVSETQFSDVGPPSLQESQSNVSDGNTTEILDFRALPEVNVYQFLPPSL